ncbi:MAG: GTP cyclohydrolase FolE2 [Pseudomonadota bacterium]
MNAPERLMLPDVQAQEDLRNLRIDNVGIKGVRYPIAIRSAAMVWHTSATFSMSVGLSAAAKGTHMSRFIELLEAQPDALDHAGFMRMAADMLTRLDAHSGTIEMRFPYFVKKSAPISGVKSLLDIDVCWRASISEDGRKISHLQVLVPATSLCPCSRDISDYGAHNQRSHISIGATLTAEMSIEELVNIAERSASCEVYGLLKRADEKYVTERAYDNPKFVEDIVRDVALSLRQHPAVDDFIVEVENFESIHNHSAFARISGIGQG